MKRVSFLVLVFSILFASTSFAYSLNACDWQKIKRCNLGPVPFGPAPNGPLSWNSQNTCNSQINFDCQNISIPNPQVVYDNDGIIPIGNFVERAGKVYFCYLNGIFARNTWLKTKGKWYYFDMTSVMIKGFIKINGLVYYFNSDGSMATGTTIINGVTHYFDASGAMVF